MLGGRSGGGIKVTIAAGVAVIVVGGIAKVEEVEVEQMLLSVRLNPQMR